jgi:hypothetical protein
MCARYKYDKIFTPDTSTEGRTRIHMHIDARTPARTHSHARMHIDARTMHAHTLTHASRG